MGNNYYLGLDIGTDSIGYAVTDHEYNLVKKHGEPMWGVTLFDEANLNTDRRAFRVARRRLDRRKQRIKLLEELFAHEIAKTDPNFFIRMKGSALSDEDKTEEGNLFGCEGYTDKDYHREYPTIHHLIYELMNSSSEHDPRLVYLACAWLIAHRGHFLSEISVDHIGELTDFSSVYRELIDFLLSTDDQTVIPWEYENTEISDKISGILKKKTTVSSKYRELCPVMFGSAKAPKETENFPYNTEVLIKLLCGSTVKAAELFLNDEYKEIESFSLDSPDEKLAIIMSDLGEDAELIIKCKAVFDWALLADTLDGFDSVSGAKIGIYNQHKEDLATLKYFVRKYAPDRFNEVFRDAGKENYAAYSYHNTPDVAAKIDKKAGKEVFSKFIKKIVSSFSPDESDKQKYDDMIERIDAQSFLPKQKDTDNRVIPHQLYLYELNKILENASAYIPFLREKDADGLSGADKIRSIFTFRVPYYVGPLNPFSKEHAWIRFKAKAGPILPWNFDKYVDTDESEKEFIRRMINRCTYLPDADVIPKNSLIYQKYTVLNEINNIEVDGQPVSVETKQAIYNDLFMKNRKVSRKKLEDYLRSNNILLQRHTVSGIDETIKSSLGSWHDFRRLLESGKLTEEQVEEIIEWSTYSDERSRFVKRLEEKYGFLPKEDIAYISKLKYNDFGRLSREFLDGIVGTEKSAGTGDAFTIVSFLWNTNNNLMQLLSDRFTFSEYLTEYAKAYFDQNKMTLDDRLDSMYISNAVKRPIRRTLEIVKEIVKVSGCAPDKIFIEMARGGKPDDKGKRTKSRKDQILELYDSVRNEDVRLLKEQLEEMGEDADSRLQGDRLFLYFMQLGRCMYSGERIDITKLKGTIYNIEHIYPQAYIKDDSILNNEVLVLSEINGEKSDTYPIKDEIRSKMHGFWVMLKDAGLITEEKYKRLTRATPFTPDEKMGFINRQLTETSQSTKAVATLLKEYYPDTEIVYVKARLASDFRQEFGLLKSRTYNDLHHAKDAYLNIVCGNVYDMKFSKRWFDVNREYSIKTKTVFSKKQICGGEIVWAGDEMLEKVKRTVKKNNVHLTRYAFCRHGGLFDQMPVKAAPDLIPIKKGLPTEKYGGYNKPAVTFFILSEYHSGKKKELMLVPVELMCSEKIDNGTDSATEYLCDRIRRITGKTVDSLSFPLGMRKIKINTVLSLDGFRITIAGTANGGKSIIAAPFMPFSADFETEQYMKKLEVLAEKANNNPGFVYHAEYDKVTPEENLRLYDTYVNKLKTTIYSKRPNNPVDALEKGRERFVSLSPVEQAKAILNIHQVFGRVSGGCDFTLIGGVAHAAATVSFSSSISNWKKNYKDVRIIDTSVAGLFETRSVNLLDLI